jgi:hypothetical protein
MPQQALTIYHARYSKETAFRLGNVRMLEWLPSSGRGRPAAVVEEGKPPTGVDILKFDGQQQTLEVFWRGEPGRDSHRLHHCGVTAAAAQGRPGSTCRTWGACTCTLMHLHTACSL